MRARLLAWFDEVERDLPWRRTRDPYAIWVSEIMLQQTRVDTVVPYFTRFMERFPTAHALARASEDEVLSMWSGLGYYRRARLLHRGAREVVERYGGRMPVDPDERRSLPGIGRYTAGAIGSIAFDRPEPLVDGNVARVLARIFGVETPLGRTCTEARLWALAASMVDGSRPGALNQALMELGALVCTPSRPRCASCPVRSSCAAAKLERQSELPVRRLKRPPRPVALVAVAAFGRDGVWLVRADGALFGGLYGLPAIETSGRSRRASASLAREALETHGIHGTVRDAPTTTVRHTLTHRALEVTLHLATDARARATATRRRFASNEFRDVGISTLTRKLLEAAERERSLSDPRV